MAAEGALQEQTLREAGFNDQEIGQWRSDTTTQLQGAGFAPSEIGDYFGQAPGKPADVSGTINQNLKDHLQARTPEGGGPAKASSFGEAFLAGLQGSSGGLMYRGKLPDYDVTQDQSLLYKTAQSVGMNLGDLPAMYAGAAFGADTAIAATGETGPGAIPAAVVGAGIGGFALPAALRKAYMTDLQNGAAKDWSDYFSRIAGVAYEGIKAGAVGATTAAGGAGAAGLAENLGATATTQIAAKTAAELTTMVTVGKAMEGEAPKPEDFVVGAATLAGFHLASAGVSKVSGTVTDLQTKLQNTYAETGMKPGDVLEAASKNPVLKQQLLSKGTDVPEILSPKPEGTQLAEPSPELAEPHPTLGEGFAPPDNIRVEKQTAPESPGESPVDFSKSQNSDSESKSPEQQIQERIGEETPKPKLTFDKVYGGLLDRLNPVKNIVDSIQDGKPLPIEKDPFALFRLAGASDGKADAFVRFGPRDVEGTPTGTPGLKQIFKDAGGDVDGLINYAIAKHSLELEAAGKETGVPQDAAKTFVEANAGKFEKPLQSLVKFQNDMLGYLKDSGVISPELHDKSVSDWESYVPFNRVDQGGPSGKGANSTMPIKAIEGSDLKLVNPLESIIRNTFAYTRIADLNRAKQAYVDLAGPAGVAEKVPTPMRPIEVQPKEIQKNLEKQGFDLPVAPEAFDIWRPLSLPTAPDEMAVMREGKRETWNVGEDVAKAVQADPSKIPALVKILSFPSKLLRTGAVDTLDFLTRHAMRDSVNAYVYSENGFKPVYSTLVGLKEFFTQGDAYQDWLASGGAMANFTEVDRDYLKNDIYSLSKQTGLIDKAQNVLTNPLQMAKLGLDLMHYLAEGVVSAPRIAEFKLAQEAGKSDLQAAYEARNVTLDNQRMGAAESVRMISTMKAFWNTRIQGLDRMVQAIADNPTQTLARFGAAITLPSVALWWLNKDDDRYKDAPQWEKDLFFFLPTPWGMARIPKPFEAGQLFGSLPERTLNSFYQKEPDQFKGFGNTLAEGANLGVPYPDFAKPMIEQFANRSMLTGGNLVSQSLSSMAPEYQYNPYTSEAAKIMANMVGHIPVVGTAGVGNITPASPLVLSNYVRAWTGGMGQYVLGALDQGLEKAGVTPPKVEPTKTLADTPFLKAFFVRYPSAGAQPIQDFYDNFAKAQTRVATIQGLEKRGEIAALQGYMSSAQAQQHVLQMTQVEKTLGAQNRAVQFIYANPGLSPNDKRQKIDELYYTMISEAKAANAMMNAADAAAKGAPN